MQLLAYPDQKKVHLYSEKDNLFRRDIHGEVWEEGDTQLASQGSQVLPGNHWGERCCSQIALTTQDSAPHCSKFGGGELLHSGGQFSLLLVSDAC